MEVLRELDIETFLTAGGAVFVSRQFDVTWDPERKIGGSAPDIVALDLKAREIVVVEVTTASSLVDLLKKIETRQAGWYDPIRLQLKNFGTLADGWDIRFLGFVREANVAKAKARFAGDNDVAFVSIEDATFPWKYWTSRGHHGLPR
jgi:hypothetical protein